MKRIPAAILAALALLVAVPAPAQEKAAAESVLDDWHDAAAKADEPRYFGHFAPDGVFLGTDATERWTAPEFREWAKPFFAKGKAWTFRARDRHLAISPDGTYAWFDELLDTQNLGVCRGSGVLRKDAGAWKILLYDLSIPIPNDLAHEVVKRIGDAGQKPAASPTAPPRSRK